MPRVSIVMSVYNGGEFLKDSIVSILDQTFEDFEFVIVDDGSTDGSADVVRSFADPRIILVRQANAGIASALNRGILISRGGYVARQDADDFSHPKRLSLQVRYLDSHPEVAVVGTGSLIIDPAGRAFSTFVPYTRHKRLVADLLRGVCPLIHGSVMARRGALVGAGGYKPVFGHAQDVELWLRMSSRWRLANMRDFLYQLRKHNSSITQQGWVDLKIRAFAKSGGFSANTNAEEWVRFVEEFDRDFKGSRWESAFESEDLLRKARVSFSKGSSIEGARLLFGALRLNPGLLVDVPSRVFHRLRRTYFP